MRLHHLEIQAFGPFPDQVEIDFDALSEAGLFLLTGATGAGKTSVLDAVCFALYGDVPGARGVAKRLRCDNAPPERAPQVVLELSLAGRRFRLTRSPAWERPKLRGSGMTTVQARVVCEERRDGAWEALSTRLDETGQLIGTLLGMTMAQFCQVAMLPQGAFQGFLRARSDERHQLLQQLFATNQFEQVERWIREQARARNREAAAHAQTVVETINHLEEVLRATAHSPASPLLEQELDDADQSGAVAQWMRAGSAAAETEVASADALRQSAEAQHKRAQVRLAEARRQHDLLARAETARSDVEALEAAHDTRTSHERRLTAARQAEALSPLHRLVEQADAAVVDHTDQLVQHLARLATTAETLRAPWWSSLDELHTQPLSTAAVKGLSALRSKADEAVATLRALRPLLDRLGALADKRTQARARLAQLAKQGEEASKVLESLPLEVSNTETRLESLQQEAEPHALLHERSEQLAQTVESARMLDKLGPELTGLSAETAAARERVSTSKERWLALREARLDGMAAELAESLVAGHPCSVCGSTSHPDPAQLTPDRVTAEDEQQAHDDVAAAERRFTASTEAERSLAAEVQGLRALVAGRSLDDLEASHATARAAADAARRASDQIGEVRTLLANQQAQVERQKHQAAALAQESTALTATLDALDSEHDQLQRQVAEGIDGYGSDDPERLIEAAEAARRQLSDAHECCLALVAAQDNSREARDSFSERLRQSSFDDTEAFLSALLPDSESAVLQQELKAFEQRELAAQATLAEPAVQAALAAELIDLDGAVTAADEAERAHNAAHSTAERARAAHARIVELTRTLDDALARWRPRVDEARAAGDLAALLEGKSTDNRLKMRLSTYVVAWRLGQVVDSANERLSSMTGGRYSLVHSDRRANRETRGGLSIEVRDDWSGEEREPATLSGGETFVVSLALALGLADVVTAESGGTSLDTLFVDEGFGSLDAETLDDVLDVLDSLRDGGRVIGVVSHVAEMRSRIPAQLRVIKEQGGSRVKTAVGGDHLHVT